MTRTGPVALVLLLLACGGKTGDDSTPNATGTATGAGTGAGTGTATGTGTGTGTATGTTQPDIFDVTVLAPNQACGPDNGGEVLDLTGLSERIDVIHQGVQGSVCAQWQITAVATQSLGRIEVTYEDATTNTCGTPCWWTIEYFLNDLPEGDWTVTAGTEEQTATVLP